MANGQGKTIHPGFTLEAAQLCPDTGSGHFAVIEKHIPPGGFDFMLKRHLFSHRFRCGPTVNEIKYSQRSEYFHQPGHLLGLAGEQAAHMVIQAGDTGDLS